MHQRLRFTKMHGLGNDFMVIDGVTQNIHLTERLITRWSDRHTGVGFDQLLLVEAPKRRDVDFKYRIFNADGSEVENCGNGARCFARFVSEQRLTGKRTVRVETQAGILTLTLQAKGQVTIDMGQPRWQPEDLPFVAGGACSDNGVYTVMVPTLGEVTMGIVSMGNPHAVILVDDIDQAPVNEWGAQIESFTALFPNKVNVGFMQVIDDTHVKLRVFERGVGETRACGTGACAAVTSGVLQGLLGRDVRVQLPGGELTIDWHPDAQGLVMTGPTRTVYEGRISF